MASRGLARRLLCTTLACSVPTETAFAESAPQNLKGHIVASRSDAPTIAVIGGGAAGLLSARELAAMGYAVTVFEATGRVGGVSTTHRDSDGRAYDLSTVFMASGDLYGEGLSECMSSLVDEAGLSDNVVQFHGATTQWQDFPIPGPVPFMPTSMRQALQVGQGQQVLDQIITMVKIFDEVVRDPTPGIASTLDIARAAESFKNWSSRLQVSIIGDLLITLTDALMAGPAARSYTPYVLNQRARLGPAVLANYVPAVVSAMRNYGQTPNLEGAPASFRALLKRGVHPSWLTFEEYVGFEDLWSGLADSLQLEALWVNAPVEAVDVLDSGGMRVRTVAGIPERVFEFVVLAVPPHHAHPILSASSGLPRELVAARDAYAAVPRDHGSFVVAVRTASGPIDGSGAMIVEMEPSYYVRSNRPVSVAKLYADSDVYTMGIYIAQSCTQLNLTAAAAQAVAQIESKLHPRMVVEEIIATTCFDNWPYRPGLQQVDAGFFEVLEAAQGKAGIYLTGELHAGAGVPAIAQYTAATVKQHFASVRGTSSFPSTCRVQPSKRIFQPPVDRLSDDAFGWAVTFIVWTVVCFTGFGSEVIVGHYLFSKGYTHLRQFLHLAEALFPIFLLIAIGLRTYLSLVFLVLGLWKLGTPQCYYWLGRSIFADKRTRATQSLNDGIRAWANSLGLVMHHSATAWAVCSIVTGKEEMNRGILSTMLPLVIQHVVTVMRHSRFHKTHVCLLLAIEALWEWEVLYWLGDDEHATLNICVVSWIMLAAHWCFIVDGLALNYGYAVASCAPDSNTNGRHWLSRFTLRRTSFLRETTVSRYSIDAGRPIPGAKTRRQCSTCSRETI